MKRAVPCVAPILLGIALIVSGCGGGSGVGLPHLVQQTTLEVSVRAGEGPANWTCADVSVTTDGDQEVFQSVETPWTYTYTAVRPDEVQVSVCPTCVNCGLGCDPSDGSTVGLTIDGVGQLGRGTNRGCISATWVIP